MKKADHNPQQTEPDWSDADYQQDMRVDPLTTTDRINSELSELNKSREERAQIAAAAAKEEAEAEARAEEERKIEAAVAQRMRSQSQSDPKAIGSVSDSA